MTRGRSYGFIECIPLNCKYYDNPWCNCPDSPEGCQGCTKHVLEYLLKEKEAI